MLTGPDAETVELRPERSVEMRFALADTGALGPGVYTLSVSLPLDALDGRSRRLRNSLDRKITFEIRTPKTAAELADAWLQMGYVATRKGRHGEARHWAERVLTVMPASVVAKVDIDFSWLRENDCGMAVPALEHAIGAIERGDDAALERSGGRRTEWAAELARTLRRRCPG